MFRCFCFFANCFVLLTLATCYYIQSNNYDRSFYNSYRDFKNDRASLENTGPSQKELEDALSTLPQNGELFEGDMIFDGRLRNAVQGVSKKSALSVKKILWPNGILYYEVEPDFKGIDLMKKAIEEFERRTCIRFQKRTNEKDYVEYSSKEDMCSSNVGRIGGRQVIHLGEHCHVLGTFEHETMHALGFIHEHSRPERDDYVKVKWDNIKKSEWPNFNKYRLHDVDPEDVKYNFASVMHYRNDAFTSNGKDTLQAFSEPTLQFGQRIKFSVGDIKGINTLYKCSEKLKVPDYHGLFSDYTTLSKDASTKRRYLEAYKK